MTRLRQELTPLPPLWTEYFYSGSIQVVNGEVETDNESWLLALYAQGYREIIDDPVVEDEKVEGEELRSGSSPDAEASVAAESDAPVVETVEKPTRPTRAKKGSK